MSTEKELELEQCLTSLFWMVAELAGTQMAMLQILRPENVFPEDWHQRLYDLQLKTADLLGTSIQPPKIDAEYLESLRGKLLSMNTLRVHRALNPAED